jgi:hypothetical protein
MQVPNWNKVTSLAWVGTVASMLLAIVTGLMPIGMGYALPQAYRANSDPLRKRAVNATALFAVLQRLLVLPHGEGLRLCSGGSANYAIAVRPTGTSLSHIRS